MKDNSKHLNPRFDSNNNSNYVMYLDYNSLYASVMCQPHPIGIRKLCESEINNLIAVGLDPLPTDGETCYWVLCGTEQISPEVANLRELEHRRITATDLSPYAKDVLIREGGKYAKTTKLVGSHSPKENYLIALNLLQIFMQHSLRLKA